jgi:microcystin-dependent protein
MDQQIKDLTDWALALSLLPAGISLDYRGATAPAGTLPEDGSTVLRTGAQAKLFTAIGTLYGAGDGSTTFVLPDSRGRVNVGKGTHADVATVGNSDGLAVGSRRTRHKHTINESAHRHQESAHTGDGTNIPWSIAGDAAGGNGAWNPVLEYTQYATTGLTVGPQTGSEPTDSSAYLVALKVVTL